MVDRRNLRPAAIRAISSHIVSIHEELTCLFIVCETMFTVGESEAISYANGTEQQTQERRLKILAGDLTPKNLWSKKADLKFNASNEEGDGSNKQRRRKTITNEFRMLM